MWKWTSKERAINIIHSFFGCVNILASRAINLILFFIVEFYFNSWCSQIIAHSYRKNILAFTKNTGTNSKSSHKIFWLHESQSRWTDYVPRMDQTIKFWSFVINFHKSKIMTTLLLLLIFKILFIRCIRW